PARSYSAGTVAKQKAAGQATQVGASRCWYPPSVKKRVHPPCLQGNAMHSRAEVPQAYRQLFFVNAGGPSRTVVSREVVQKKWQLVTLDCAHRVLLPNYQKSARIGCGFCGGLEPLE